VRRILRELDPGLAAWDVRTMGEVRAATTWEQRFFGKLMGAFAAQALLLACLGVYGVLAYAVSRRTHEIGVRLALGARPADVVSLVVGRGARMALAGVALGLLLSLAVGQTLQGILYGVSGSDLVAFAGDGRADVGGGAARELAAGASRGGRRPDRRAADGVATASSRAAGIRRPRRRRAAC
jgi:ABC-type antimicrobial peptide transport system permease subunit